MEAEKQRLYTPDDEAGESHASELRRLEQSLRQWRTRFYAVLVACVAALVVLAGVSSLLTARGAAKAGVTVPLHYSPANGMYQFEPRTWLADPDSHKFMGKPREEMDQAWHDLLQGTFIRVSEEELRLADNSSSVRLQDGGYIAGLGVSHNLHCLRRIKQYIYKDHYYPGDNQDWEEIEYHAEHCLESLRQSVMCQIDVTLLPLKWVKRNPEKPKVKVTQAQTCANWEVVHDWMRARSVRSREMVRPPPEWFDGKSEDEWED